MFYGVLSMLSNTFLSKAVNAVSALALTGILFHTSAWAMDDSQENAAQQSGLHTIQNVTEEEPSTALPTSPSRIEEDAILSEINIFAINNLRAPEKDYIIVIPSPKPDFSGTFNPEGKFVPAHIGGKAFFVDRPDRQFKFDK